MTKPPIDGLIRDRLIDEGYARGEADELEIVDPLLASWIAAGRQGFDDEFTGAEE